ncbi:hypothetical protein F5144DRAFT_651723 [Chaetomium tenue]|uniref:Uncharacterized protein n=1 Tax=Chaetomium tenue TaxID=1854479 RepID=A0ACB7P2H6_9PEZI|nr:hypothetical protein F5144DRAFT_651723 [Chaetomium globosum]
MATKKTILFLGATGGVGLSALRRSLAAGHTCIALCRTPANLTAQLNTTTTSNSNTTTLPPNLHIITGNAHNPSDLHACLTHPSTAPSGGVDIIVSSIGARPTLRGMSDAHVCEKGMEVLLGALRAVKEERVGGKVPRLVAVSSTGISEVARDVPILLAGLYKVLLHTPHVDKKKMERLVVAAGGKGEVEWTLVRGSFYTSGSATEGLVRVGVEDPVKGVREKEAVGYTISREDVGKWMFEECLDKEGREWVGKAAILTY